MAAIAFNQSAQKTITELFQSLIAEEKECGLQATAYLNGKLVLDVFGGTLDAVSRRPVTGDSLFPIFSTGKGIASTIVHLLAERGRLDYDAPIATYWPEFAAHGKEGVTVRHAMSHTAGLAQLPVDMPADQLHSWDAMCRWLADAAPATPPGEEMLYHGVTFGWLLGEIAHRADGRPFTQQVEEEICKPLGMTAMYFGIPDAVESRVATIEDPAPEPPQVPAPTMAMAPDCAVPHGAWMNTRAARRSCIPGSAGIMNTRAIARHYAALLPGGIDGVELLPPSRIQAATVMQMPKHRTEPTRQGLGYILGNVGPIFGDRPHAFGHQGYGGSVGFADPSANLAVSFARNRFRHPEAPALVIKAITRALGVG